MLVTIFTGYTTYYYKEPPSERLSAPLSRPAPSDKPWFNHKPSPYVCMALSICCLMEWHFQAKQRRAEQRQGNSTPERSQSDSTLGWRQSNAALEGEDDDHADYAAEDEQDASDQEYGGNSSDKEEHNINKVADVWTKELERPCTQAQARKNANVSNNLFLASNAEVFTGLGTGSSSSGTSHQANL